MAERANCRTCGAECSVNTDGAIRFHHGKKPEHYAGPDSKKCKGAGELPEGVSLPETVTGYACRVPAGPNGCGRPVQITANGRARSHLNNAGHRCPGGSDWPIAVDEKGNRRDTAPGPDEETAADRAELEQAVEAPCLCASDADGEPGLCPQHGKEPDPRDVLADWPVVVGLDPSGPEGVASERLAPGYDPRDPEGPGVTTLEELRAAEADEALGCVPEPGPLPIAEPDVATRIKALPPEERAAAVDAVFDITHKLTGEDGVEQVHPGEAADCRLPGCCTHPDGFTYVDDDNGHCGSFCAFCGAEEPEPPAPGPDDWRKCPADLLAKMPADVQELAATSPECWFCGHEVTPVVEQFGIVDGEVGVPKVIVWTCSRDCGWRNGGHTGEPCDPQRPEQARLGELEVGALFRRHTLPDARLAGLVYRVQATGSVVSALVVSAGPYGGRTGELTDLQERITCTDLDGNPLPRRSPTPSRPQAPSPTETAGDRSSKPGTSRPATPPSASATARSGKATVSGPMAPAASPTPSASKRRTDVADAFATPKQAVKETDKYDSYGRYKLLHPKTGKPVKWTRATTFCKSIQDTYALSMWSQRMVLKGAALRPDIVDAASTLHVKEDKDRMNGLVEEAKKAAGDKVAANRGTAVHKYTEERDLALAGVATEVTRVPDRHQPTVDAYEELLREFGLEPVPGLIEFTTAVLQYEIAGTSDRVYRVTKNMTFKLHGRMVTLYAGEYVIGDVKTGADLSYGWMEIAIQLATYSQGLNANGYWDWGDRQWHVPHTLEDVNVRLQVRTDVAIVPHLPVDRKEGDPLATLYAVDLDTGWANAVLCAQVRASRKESGLATPLKVAYLDLGGPQVTPQKRHSVPSQTTAAGARDSSTPAVREATLEEKARAVINSEQASAVWTEAKGTPGMTRQRLAELTAIMKAKLESHVEKAA